MANQSSQPLLVGRRGGRRRADVPRDVLSALSLGQIETVNLMEWLAADMPALARNVANEMSTVDLRRALQQAADKMAGAGITSRLKIAGREIVAGVTNFACAEFQALAAHRSDLVRQWACYAVNDELASLPMPERLTLTARFASDPNMSVREAAWMAFRPHLALGLREGVRLLDKLAAATDANLRRFAIEVTRPRSVWGTHLEELKRQPHICRPMLERVRSDDSRYVRLAAGNWLNDASKSQPEWVRTLCARWEVHGDLRTEFIIRRALRTLGPLRASPKNAARNPVPRMTAARR